MAEVNHFSTSWESESELFQSERQSDILRFIADWMDADDRDINIQIIKFVPFTEDENADVYYVDLDRACKVLEQRAQEVENEN